MFMRSTTPATLGAASSTAADLEAHPHHADRQPPADTPAFEQRAPVPACADPVCCDYCGGTTCGGDCDGYYDGIADDIDARYEAWRDREIES